MCEVTKNVKGDFSFVEMQWVLLYFYTLWLGQREKYPENLPLIAALCELKLSEMHTQQLQNLDPQF